MINVIQPSMPGAQDATPPSEIAFRNLRPRTPESNASSCSSCITLEDFDESARDCDGIPAADPYFFYTLDDIPLKTKEQQEIVELKLKIAKQQEQLEASSSRLGRCQEENEVLRIENAKLVEELVAARAKTEADERRRSSPCRNSPRGGRAEAKARALREANDALTYENGRLRVVADVMRKSFKAYVRDGKRASEESERARDLDDGFLVTTEPPRGTLPHGKQVKLARRSSGDFTAETVLSTIRSSGCSRVSSGRDEYAALVDDGRWKSPVEEDDLQDHLHFLLRKNSKKNSGKSHDGSSAERTAETEPTTLDASKKSDSNRRDLWKEFQASKGRWNSMPKMQADLLREWEPCRGNDFDLQEVRDATRRRRSTRMSNNAAAHII